MAEAWSIRSTISSALVQSPGSNFPFRYPKSVYLRQDDEITGPNDAVGVIGFAYVVAPWLFQLLLRP